MKKPALTGSAALPSAWRSDSRRRDALTAYAYILPSLLLITAFYLLPILMTAFYSFTKFNLLQAPEYVGLDNFGRLFSDPFVRASIMNTLYFTAITVPVQSLLALLLAAVMASRMKSIGKRLAIGSTFIPVISSMIIVGVLWRMMFNTDVGIINAMLAIFGADPVNWLGGKATALISVCIVMIWKNVGYFLVIYYVAILDIPRSLYEAAEMDGANWWKKFFLVTLPSLRGITYLVVTLGTIWSFQVFDLVYIMTGGGPGTSTVTLVMTVYNAAFKQYEMGYAAAISLLLFAIVVVITIIQKRFLGERE